MMQRPFILFLSPSLPQTMPAEGRAARISAIDSAFHDLTRVYASILKTAEASEEIDIADGVRSITLNPQRAKDQAVLEDLIETSSLVYVHTMNQALHVASYVSSGKVVVDIHGLPAEEARMSGFPRLADFFEGVEYAVLKQAKVVVVVSSAMADFFRAKYPDCSPEYLVIPAIPHYHHAPVNIEEVLRQKDRSSVVYAGGIHKWQNIPLMLDACAKVGERHEYAFLSDEHEQLQREATAAGITQPAYYGHVTGDALQEIYRKASFGFILRDQDPVNQDACPTKLTDYLRFGVIPIIKSAEIGDFAQLGYKYVRIADFIAGDIPDETELAEMRRANRNVYDQLSVRHDAGIDRIRSLLPMPTALKSVAGLYSGYDTVFPSYGEMYLIDGEHTAYTFCHVVNSRDSIDFSPTLSMAGRILRIFPLAAEKFISIDLIEIMVEPGSPPIEIDKAVVGGTLVDGQLFMDKTDYIDLQLSTTSRIKALRLTVTFRWLGAYAKAMLAAGPLDRGLELPLAIAIKGGPRELNYTLQAALRQGTSCRLVELERVVEQHQRRIRELEDCLAERRQYPPVGRLGTTSVDSD